MHGCPVVPLPGPCAAITAHRARLGLPTDRFAFEGFSAGQGRDPATTRLQATQTSATTRWCSTRRRIGFVATLEAMLLEFGAEREVVLARELTKSFETIRRAPLAVLA